MFAPKNFTEKQIETGKSCGSQTVTSNRRHCDWTRRMYTKMAALNPDESHNHSNLIEHDNPKIQHIEFHIWTYSRYDLQFSIDEYKIRIKLGKFKEL